MIPYVQGATNLFYHYLVRLSKMSRPKNRMAIPEILFTHRRCFCPNLSPRTLTPALNMSHQRVDPVNTPRTMEMAEARSAVDPIPPKPGKTATK